MSKILEGALVVAVFGMGTGCVNRATQGDTGKQRDLLIKSDTGPSPISKWAISAGGTSRDEGHCIAVDGAGNSYVTGHFEGRATFGSITLTSRGNDDIFVAKVDRGGEFIWAVSAGGTSYEYSHSIALDGSGNSYITGYFLGTAIFGTTTLRSKGYSDIFVAKVDRGGEFVWAVSAGGIRKDSGFSIAVDKSGDSFITGLFQITVAFGSTTLTDKGGQNLYVAKVGKSGKFLWAVSAGGSTSNDGGLSIAISSSGNKYITGAFSGTSAFGSTTLISNGDNDIFVAKIDNSGKFLWAVSAGGKRGEACYSIAVDGSDSCYVVGHFESTATFGSTTLTSRGDEDIFVAKLDKSGRFLWAVSAGGASRNYGYSIAVDGSGSSYIVGHFEKATTFGSTTLTSKGYPDIFVAKLDESGRFLGAVSAGGTSGDWGTSLAVDISASVYITGHFYSTAVFGISTLISKGYDDIFVAKLDHNGKF
jgi:hypothetical protein